MAAYFAFWRRPAWDTPSEPWSSSSTSVDDDAIPVPGTTGIADDTSGLTAAESSLTSSSYNPQEA